MSRRALPLLLLMLLLPVDAIRLARIASPGAHCIRATPPGAAFVHRGRPCRLQPPCMELAELTDAAADAAPAIEQAAELSQGASPVVYGMAALLLVGGVQLVGAVVPAALNAALGLTAVVVLGGSVNTAPCAASSAASASSGVQLLSCL